MLSLLTRPIIDNPSAEMLRVTFEWFLDNFDREYFNTSTELVYPTRESFPDRANNEFDMAKSLCSRILKYAGLSHLPIKLVPPQYLIHEMPPLLNIDTDTRGLHKFPASVQSLADGRTLEISFASAMMKKPMDLVGSMSKAIAQHYLYQSQKLPPMGVDGFDATSEVLSIFFGFGIMIANSAYTFRGSCARCYDPRANRTAALSEDEAVYCLALFCHYKKIENKHVTPYLKGYLRGSFKKARKQVRRDTGEH